MRRFREVLAAVGALIVVSMPSTSSQGQTSPVSTGASRDAMMLNRGLHRELKLDASQIPKVLGLARKLRADEEEAMRLVRDLPAGEQLDKFRELRRVIVQRTDKDLAAILNPAQTKRFHQIRIQVGGAAGMNQPDLQNALRLTAGQKTEIARLLKEEDVQWTALMEDFRSDREGTMKRYIAVHKDTNRRALALLDPIQRRIWDSLTGDPFEFKPDSRPEAASRSQKD